MGRRPFWPPNWDAHCGRLDVFDGLWFRVQGGGAAIQNSSWAATSYFPYYFRVMKRAKFRVDCIGDAFCVIQQLFVYKCL